MAVAPLPMLTRRGPQILTDESLVTLVAAGDECAFEEIFDRYAAALLGFCVQMLGSRDWAEDALQLTFVAAYRALRKGACDGALRPWLYAIARNRCLSELRTRREFPDSDRVNADRPAIDGPASVVARRERLRELVDDIQRLPEDQRAAVVLFELAGQSHEEIATVLGVRREKVKALIFQARQGLQRGRSARDSACSDVRHHLANAVEKIPARGSIRAHIERCAPCQEFEREVSRQRAAFAFLLPVVVTGAVKSSVLSAVLGRGAAGLGVGSSAGGVGAAAGGGALTSTSGGAATSGGAMSVAGAGAATAGGGTVATAAGGSAATAVGGGALTAAAGGAGPTVVASALGGEAVAGAGVLTSSVSIASVAKLATAVVVAVGVGGVTRSAFAPSPRAQAAIPVAQRSAPAPRTPLQPLASGIAGPLLSRGGINPHAPLSPAPMGAPGAGPSNGPQNSAAGGRYSPNPAAGGAPNSPGTGGSASVTGPGSAPSSGPGGGGVTPASAPSGSSSPPGGPTTNTSSGVNSAGTSGGSTGGATAPPPPPPTSSPTHGNGRASGGGNDGSGSGGTASAGSGGSISAGSGANAGSGNGPASSGQGPSSSSNAGGGDGAHGGGPPSTPPGCVGNSSPGCVKKGSH